MKYFIIAFLAFVGIACAQQAGRLLSDPRPYTNLTDIAAVVPADIKLRVEGKSSLIDVEKANEVVVKEVRGKLATLRLKVHHFEPFKADGWGYRIMAPDGELTVRGAKIGYRIWAYFRPDQADALAKVGRGFSITLSGKLGRADIRMYDGRPVLSLDLIEAKVEKR